MTNEELSARSGALTGIPNEIVERFRLDRMPLDRRERPTSDLLRLDGRRALVTGAGGDGSGDAICHRLAEQGAAIAVLDVNAEAAQRTAAEVSARWGVDTAVVVADVADEDQVLSGISKVVDRFKGIDILVNNAGGSGSIGRDGQHGSGTAKPFYEMSSKEIETVTRVNFLGVLMVTRAVLDVMVPARAGRIINISSESALTSSTGVATYASSKAGVIAFTRNLAHDIGPLGLSTVAVCPGVMLTGMALRAMASPDAVGLAARLENGYQRTTIGRFSVPDEVASVVAFLASEAGAYVHGTSVSVGGGFAG